MSLLVARLRRLSGRLALSWTLFVIAGVVVGLVIAPYAFTVATEPDGTVAVVPIEGGIDGPTAAEVTASLSEAQADDSIKAVVLVSNSPGGSASASETMYMEVARTAEQMPVVGYVDAMAASGAYYALAPSDHITAKPSSLVGSVGVFAVTPADPQPLDEVIATGPDKLSGGDERAWMHKTESLRHAFVGAVVEHRGDRLELSRAEVSEASLYTGGEAVNNGIVDDIGSLRDSVREAAARADLDDYDVEVLRPERDENASAKFMTRTNYVASDDPDKELVSPSYFLGELGTDPAVPYIVMVPPSVFAATASDANATDDDAVVVESEAQTESEGGTNESTPENLGVIG